jgi:hypothetical protein
VSKCRDGMEGRPYKNLSDWAGSDVGKVGNETDRTNKLGRYGGINWNNPKRHSYINGCLIKELLWKTTFRSILGGVKPRKKEEPDI